MKLFTKDIDKKLFAQYPKGSDLANQMVVAKIFNPYGRGTWYIINSDPDDPDYLWAIVDLFDIEAGSVSRSELENILVPPFRLNLERDSSFSPTNALELYNGLRQGKMYQTGGTADSAMSNDPMIGGTMASSMARGGIIKQIPVGEEYRYKGSSSIEPEILAKIQGQLSGLKFAGNFGLKGFDAYLYFLDDYDRKLVENITVKPNERIYRYYTRATAIGGMIPLIKVNLDSALVYFNESQGFGDESIKFQSSGIKANYINLVKVGDEDYYAHGGQIDMLKEDDFVWNAAGKKLVVDKVTEDEYFLSGFMQAGSSPFGKQKVHEYIKTGYWSLKPKMARGGDVGRENAEMVANNIKQIAHHTKEMAEALKGSDHVPAWVVSKVYRASSDLSDATHYMDGESNKMAEGGEVLAVGDIFDKTKNAKYDYDWQLFKPRKSYIIHSKTNKVLSVHDSPYEAIKEKRKLEESHPNQYLVHWEKFAEGGNVFKSDVVIREDKPGNNYLFPNTSDIDSTGIMMENGGDVYSYDTQEPMMAEGGGVGDFKVINDKFTSMPDNPKRVYHEVEGLYDGYWFKAKTDNSYLHGYGSDGIKDKSVYQLVVWRGGNPVGRDTSTKGCHVSEDLIADYNNKWDYKPRAKKDKQIVDDIVDFLDNNVANLKQSYTSVKFAEGGATSAQKRKIGKVMHEWKAGKLHSGSKKGPIVKSQEQAVAIALSEAGLSKNTKPKGWKHKRK